MVPSQLLSDTGFVESAESMRTCPVCTQLEEGLQIVDYTMVSSERHSIPGPPERPRQVIQAFGYLPPRGVPFLLDPPGCILRRGRYSLRAWVRTTRTTSGSGRSWRWEWE